MRLRNGAYREIVQASVESITKAVMSCKLIQLQRFTSLSICSKRIWFENIFFSWTKYFEFNICFRSDRLCWAQCLSPGVSAVLGGVFWGGCGGFGGAGRGKGGKLFDNSLGSSYTMFAILDITFHFTCG